ncbi:50S ribosomal protein L3 [Reinekea sp.]|jgi:large subunit ribosomal protein L3|uniref:50S ribosomal protein L3 n=1 Tax=Reinekea sp. TaxID=1970455 RepID=UPI003989428D
MSIGLIGRKQGMTRIFTEDGVSIPVTVVEVEPNRVSQVKTIETDGYVAIQLTVGNKRANKVSKAEAGHFAKANVEMGDSTREFTVADASEYEAGKELTVGLFEAGQKVDVTGTSKGKGFAGSIKRHNFSMQDATHGNSLSHRAPGSIGQCQTPGRVWKGKKMAGHMGAVRNTVQSLEVVRVDVERNLLLIKGAVPGATGGRVVVQPAVKG